jgi:hypothetical protein
MYAHELFKARYDEKFHGWEAFTGRRFDREQACSDAAFVAHAPDDVRFLLQSLREAADQLTTLEEHEHERREAHAFLTGKFETAFVMTHPHGEPCTELGRAAKQAAADLLRVTQERDSVRLEQQATEHARLTDNAYLLSRAEVAEARVTALTYALWQCHTVDGGGCTCEDCKRYEAQG